MLQICFLGHSSFYFKSEEGILITDPYQDGSVPKLKMPHLDCNFALVSHGHRDHNATNLINIFPNENKIETEEIVVPHDHHNGLNRGNNKIYIFKMGGYKIAHLGDIGCVPSKEILQKLQNVDFMFAPINGQYTITAFELKIIYDLTNPKIIVPMHYYIKDKNIDYVDNNQLDDFKHLFKQIYTTNGYSINVTDSLFNSKAVIFGDIRQ